MKKRMLLSLTAIIIAGLMLIGLNSCETPKPCEKNNFGTVIVTNHTGQVIWVDCTQEGSDYNDERMLGISQSTQYQMRPGTVTEWAIEAWDYPDGEWYTDTYYLGQCDVHDYPWSNYKKSVEKGSIEKIDIKVIPKTKR